MVVAFVCNPQQLLAKTGERRPSQCRREEGDDSCVVLISYKFHAQRDKHRRSETSDALLIPLSPALAPTAMKSLQISVHMVQQFSDTFQLSEI